MYVYLIQKDTPIMYCNYIEELIAKVLNYRNQEANDIKLGVDEGGGGWDSLRFISQSP